jgi:hypothetical protein
MKERIALVAATALGFGVLSASPAFAAAIVANDTDITSTLKSEVCTVSTDKETAYVPSTSVGVKISPVNASDTETAFFTISGPAAWTLITAGTGTAEAINSQKELTMTDAGSAVSTYTLKPSGVGTITVTISETSGGVAIDTLTIVSQAACTGGVYSAADSFVAMDTTVAGNATSNVDVKSSATAGTPMYIKMVPLDGYLAALTTGTLSVSATNGAFVSLGASGGTLVAGGLSVATGTPTAAHAVRVDPSQSATTSTTVVTITHNGTAVATKTITFHGEQASISLAATYAGRNSTTDSGVVVFQYKDSAGNVVPGGAAAIVPASAGTRITTATSILAPNPGTKTSLLTNASLADNMEYKLGGSSDNGVMAYTCGSSAGTADFSIATTSTVNANTITATVTGKCYGGISTYTVATDKAKYNIGDIATLTISAKDSSGNPVSDNSQLQASSVSVGGGTATYTVLGTAAAGALETFTNGTVVIRAQMTTEGTFNTVVALSGAKDASAQASYTVVNPATVGAVSNADVLKSIVALIASINKQIAALQKLILARR